MICCHEHYGPGHTLPQVEGSDIIIHVSVSSGGWPSPGLGSSLSRQECTLHRQDPGQIPRGHLVSERCSKLRF